MPFLHCISSFLKVLLIKISKIQSLYLLILVAFIQLLLDINFYKFFDLHSTLSEKKISATNFPFLIGFTQPPHPPPHLTPPPTPHLPPYRPKSAKRDKSFLLMLPYPVIRTLSRYVICPQMNERQQGKQLTKNLPQRVFPLPFREVKVWAIFPG